MAIPDDVSELLWNHIDIIDEIIQEATEIKDYADNEDDD